MIDKQRGEYVLVCDVCGEEIERFDSWQDAVDGKKSVGMVSRKIDGKWEDQCADCK